MAFGTGSAWTAFLMPRYYLNNREGRTGAWICSPPILTVVYVDEEACNSNSAQQYLPVLDFQGQLPLTTFVHVSERYLPNKDSLCLSSGITSERF